MKKQILTLSLFILGAGSAFARPEYAVRHTYVSCTQCHVSPTGGGHRNLNGKHYGSFGQGLSEFSKNAWFQLDMRSEAVNTKSATTQGRGILIMTTTPSVHAPVVVDPASQSEKMGFVASYGLGMLDTGLKDSYVLFQTGNEYLQSIQVGRFQMPFGLLTDEHRTYTRMQVKSTVKDYESGFVGSSDLGAGFHYDLALTSGSFTSAGGSMTTSDDAPYTALLNVRWNPFGNAFFLGASSMKNGSYKYSDTNASSLYFATNTNELSIPGVISGEFVWSQGWNNSTINSNMSYFVASSDATWGASIADSKAFGSNLQWMIDLSPSLILQVKAERFIPDTSYQADHFNRYGVGFKYRMNGQASVLGRYEKSLSTREGAQEAGNTKAVTDFAYFLLHVWI